MIDRPSAANCFSYCDNDERNEKYAYSLYNLWKFISDQVLPLENFDYEYLYVITFSLFLCFFFFHYATHIINSFSFPFFLPPCRSPSVTVLIERFDGNVGARLTE